MIPSGPPVVLGKVQVWVQPPDLPLCAFDGVTLRHDDKAALLEVDLIRARLRIGGWPKG